MAISTNGTVIARLAGGLYNTVISNATYLEVAAQDPSTLANTLYARDFAKSTDLAVATTLVTNLGLSTVAGLANWVAAQLTAAGSANKGAKIVSLLNDFAGMSADTTYGAAATAFNTKVDAALAASQKTGSVESKFETAGVVAVANATFTLTTGVDSFAGGAGADTFNATGLTLTDTDSLTGGAGDSLVITDTSAAFTAGFPANLTITGIPTASLISTGKLGTNAALASGQSTTLTFIGSTATKAATYSITPAGATTAITASTATGTPSSGDVGAASAAAAVTSLTSLYQQLGYSVTSGTSSTTVPTVSNAIYLYAPASGTSSTTVTIKGAPGVTIPLPTITTSGSTASSDTIPDVATTAAVATTGASSADLSGWTGLTKATLAPTGGANVTLATTTDSTITTTGQVTVSGGLNNTVTGSTSVYVSGAKGAVTVTTGNPTSGGFYKAVSNSTTKTGLATAWGATDTYQTGVLVTGGTTVSITEKGASASSTTGLYSSSSSSTTIATPNTATTQVGSDALVSSMGSAIGTETIRNAALSPTGDVTVKAASTFTNVKGGKDVAYGKGNVEINTNGSTTVSLTGGGNTSSGSSAKTVTIRDIATTPLKASAGDTAVPGTSKLATVNLTGVNGAVGITTDALTTLSAVDTGVTGTAAVITVGSSSATANTGALNLTVGNSTLVLQGGTSGTPASLNNSSIAITGVASAYEYVDGTAVASKSLSDVTLNAAKATTLTFAGAADVKLNASSTLTKLTTVTSTSSNKVDLGDVSGLAKLTSVSASGSGALKAQISTTQAFQGGAGNDTVTISGIPTLTVDGGAGINTVNIANSAALTGLTTSVTNFQTLGFGVNSLSLPTALGFSSFALAGGTSGSPWTGSVGSTTGVTGSSATVTNAAYTGTVNLNNFVQDKVTVNVNLGASNTTVLGAGTTQGALTFASTTADTTTGHTVNGVETLNITSSGITNAQVLNGGTNAANSFTYAEADALKTINVTGDSDVTLTIGATTAAKVTTFDASASSGDVTVSGSTTFKSTGATIKGGAGYLTVTGTAGADTISVGSGGGAITASGGGDTITLATGQTKATTLVFANGKSTIDAIDVVNGFEVLATSKTDVLDLTGTSVIADASTATAIGSTGIYYTAKDGIMKFVTSAGVPTSVTSAVALLSAAEAVVDGAGNGYNAAFELNGSTYVVHSATLSAGLATDTVVQLVGVSGLVALGTAAAANTLVLS